MSTTTPTPTALATAPAAPAAVALRRPSGPSTGKWAQRTKLYIVLAVLMAPTLVGMVLFTYYPQIAAVKYSFYRWDASGMIEEFRGLENYRRALFDDPRFWSSFGLVLILLAANVVKMWPSIFAAVVLHRLRSERWQYVYRVLFVIPMIIPAIVGLLVWKSFFDPEIGPLNKLLNTSGLMSALNSLDGAMPALAARVQPLFDNLVNPLFASIWGMLMFGVLVLSSAGGMKQIARSWIWWILVVISLLPLMGVFPGGDAAAVMRYVLAVAVAVVIGEGFRRWKGGLGRGMANAVGLLVIAVACALVLFGMVWTAPTNAFSNPTPAWLSNTKLVIPSLIIWGFPWIGTVGVLIYLAGLQNISVDVYEAAELDGVGSVGKLFYIELPLIMTQVRINLIFLTIGTLTDYGLVLLLLGATGGPGNVGMVPGLYSYSKAFTDGEFGYSCALGMILFVIILGITLLYQKYVKVEK